jgi:hypothetical protein
MTDFKKTVDFLNGIGLKVEIERGAQGFIKGVCIRNGALFVDPGASPSNILHEAGHLAVLPSRFRQIASDNISAVQTMMMEQVDFTDPDNGEARLAMQSGDPEASAWAWAAGLAIGLPEGQIIQDHEYQNTGDEVRMMLARKSYLGINGLATTKICALREGPFADAMGLPAYPKLARWLQP